MTEMEKVTWPETVADAIVSHQGVQSSLRIASAVLKDGFKIANREEFERSADTYSLLKRGIASVTESLTEAFRPIKTREKQVRGIVKLKVLDPLEQAVAVVDLEVSRFRRAEELRAREEEIAAQHAANEAAKVEVPDGEEAPSPVQVVVQRAPQIARGVVGKLHVMRRVRAVELVDVQTALASWPEVVGLNVEVAKERYDALMKQGIATYPPEGGIIVGGVRFITETTNVSGRS